jgi:hypothetical protein
MDGLAGAFTAFMVVCGLIGAAIATAIFWGVPWLWALVKPWIHSVTG